MSKDGGGAGRKLIVRNKQAFHNYFISDRIEAGVVLVGTEVKSLRAGQVSMSDAYAEFRGGEIFLLNCHIAPYSHGNLFNHEPLRPRKLLLHQEEIKKLGVKVKERGFTLIPTQLHFFKGRVKVEIGLGKGKRDYDKRHALKERQVKRELAAETRRRD